jgi:hypothetical protein
MKMFDERITNMRRLFPLLAFLVLSVSSSVSAQLVDDVLRLAQKNVTEEVLLAFVEVSRSTANLAVADIISLKDAKVPNSVIVAMLKRQVADHPITSPPAEEQIVKRRADEQVVERRPAPAPEAVQPSPPPVVYDASPSYGYSTAPAVIYDQYCYPPCYGYPYWPCYGLSVGFSCGGGWRGGGWCGGHGGGWRGR